MLTKAELEAIRERTEKAKIGNPLRDVDALVRKEEVINEDVPKLLAEIERMRVGIMYAMQETYCDDTCDFLRRLLIGEEKTEIPYRMGHKYGGDSD